MLSIAQLRCVIRKLFADLLMSWTPGLSDFFLTEPPILLCHYFDVVLLVEVLLSLCRSRSILGPAAE